jgi:magnesium-dependent phosphatase-1
MNKIVRFKPKLVVFDLDHTLWPFGVDEFVFKPPFKRNKSNEVVDASGAKMQAFPEVTDVFKYVSDQKLDIGVASRTTFPSGVRSLIDLFGWSQYIKYKQIYPTSKVIHFNQLYIESEHFFGQMLYFDDEERNIKDVSQLGVETVQVDPKVGITKNLVINGLKLFEK